MSVYAYQLLSRGVEGVSAHTLTDDRVPCFEEQETHQEMR